MEFFLGKLREALDDGNWFRSFPAHFQAVMVFVWRLPGLLQG